MEWNTVAKVIAIMFLFGAIGLVYLLYISFFSVIDVLDRNKILTINSIPYFIKTYHLHIINIALLSTAGIGLLLRKKIGLTTGLLSVILNLMLISVGVIKPKNNYEVTTEIIIYLVLIGLGLLITGTLLMMKQIRLKYSLDKKDYLVIGIITLIVLLDIIII